MILLIFISVFFVLGIILSTLIIKEMWYDYSIGSKILGIFTGLFVFIAVMLLSVFISAGIHFFYCDSAKAEGYKDFNQEIYSVSRINSSYGRFVLGTGTIDNKNYYIYYVKSEDGGFNISQIDANTVTIYESENETPRLKWQKKVIKNSFWFGDMNKKVTHIVVDDKINFKLIVPKGTMIQSVSI
jgi:hypothetical protein